MKFFESQFNVQDGGNQKRSLSGILGGKMAKGRFPPYLSCARAVQVILKWKSLQL
jgi:hypothetical protein